MTHSHMTLTALNLRAIHSTVAVDANAAVVGVVSVVVITGKETVMR